MLTYKEVTLLLYYCLRNKPVEYIMSVLNFLVLSPVQQNYQVDFFNFVCDKYLELIEENTNHIILFTAVDDDNELFHKYFRKKVRSSKGGGTCTI